MPSDGDLIDLVAAALRGDGQWDGLSEHQKRVWRADADRAIKALRSAARTGPDVAGFEACREAIEYIEMAENRLECEDCDKCVDLARSYLVEAKAVIAALPAPAGESVTNWQPIETAPKDGTEIIVLHPEAGVCAAFCPAEGFAWHCMDGSNTTIGSKSRASIPRMTSFIEAPTHWQPLPEPPTRKSEARS